MKKITIIQLLNKIANGEEVPKKIKFDEEIYEFNKWGNDYKLVRYKLVREEYSSWLFNDYCFGSNGNRLNNEVEIVDEEDEFEDIEEKNVYMDFSCEYWKQAQIDELVDTLTRYELAIKKIIRNQKKIIERLQHENSKDNV